MLEEGAAASGGAAGSGLAGLGGQAASPGLGGQRTPRGKGKDMGFEIRRSADLQNENLWADAVLPGETSWEKVTFSGKLDF